MDFVTLMSAWAYPMLGATTDAATKHPAARMPPKKAWFRYICDLRCKANRQRLTIGSARIANKSKIRNFSGHRLPTAQSLPVSPHREFGISHRQLCETLHRRAGHRKTFKGGL